MPSFFRKPTMGEIIAAAIGAAVVAAFYNKDNIMSALPSSKPDAAIDAGDVVVDVTTQQ